MAFTFNKGGLPLWSGENEESHRIPIFPTSLSLKIIMEIKHSLCIIWTLTPVGSSWAEYTPIYILNIGDNFLSLLFVFAVCIIHLRQNILITICYKGLYVMRN